MLRLVLSVLITIVFVAFVMMNTHHVALSVVVGEPVKIRLIFLLLATFVLGIMSSSFFIMVRQVRQRKRVRIESPKSPDLAE